MKVNKLISKGLSIGLLLNYISILSYANTEIPNRYQTLEGEYITIDDSMEGNLEEIEIFGNTMQDENNLEDIQSVGDLYVDKNGNPILDKQGREQYKIEIVSQNKNYINYADVFDSNKWHDAGWDLIYKDENRFICEGNGTVNGSNGFALGVNISNLKPNTTYTISCKANGGLQKIKYVYRGRNTLWDIPLEIPIYNNTFTTPQDVTDICIGIYYNIPGRNRVEITDIQLEESNESSKYESHQYSKRTILLPTQLQKVGDIADKLYWDNSKGRYVIEKNIESVTFNGEENWLRSTANTNDTTLFYIRHDGTPKYASPYISNSEIPYVKLDKYPDVVDYEFIFIGIDYNIRINKDKLESDSVESFIKYLKKNPLMIYYQLKNPKIIETNITSKLKIPTYNEKTHVYVDSENSMNPTLKVTVDKLLQVAKEAVSQAESDNTNYNISLARMYTNMLPESLYKDQLQEQLSEIFSSDIVLDRKTVSSNLDLYIKCENILMMSLSTNSITFEDFSGIEDMTKENAVQISINSSLPYSLNAYLPAEIQNSDKSVTMNKDILNIKENSESNYQTFANTTDKIILKDNCSSGNDRVHGVNIKLKGGISHQKDVYKTTIKFEAEQK